MPPPVQVIFILIGIETSKVTNTPAFKLETAEEATLLRLQICEMVISFHGRGLLAFVLRGTPTENRDLIWIRGTELAPRCSGRTVKIELEQIDRKRSAVCHGKVSHSKTAPLWGNVFIQVDSDNFAQQQLQMERRGNIWKVRSQEIVKSQSIQIAVEQSEALLSLWLLYTKEGREGLNIYRCRLLWKEYPHAT